MKPGEVVIDVRDCRAYVSIWRNKGAQFWLEPAQNWQELEDLSIDHIESLGGYITLSGIYSANEQLAQSAKFTPAT